MIITEQSSFMLWSVTVPHMTLESLEAIFLMKLSEHDNSSSGSVSFEATLTMILSAYDGGKGIIGLKAASRSAPLMLFPEPLLTTD